MSYSKWKEKFFSADKKTLIIRGIALGTAAFALIFFIVIGAMLINLYRAHSVKGLTAGQMYLAAGNTADKLMIVAHPDDEALWGGAHLYERGWLVVCITNGRNSTRAAEFSKAVTASGNQGLILEYPDKVNFIRDDWADVYSGIESDVAALLAYRNWKVIATHNPDGEYGHEHHKMTSSIVTNACAEKGMSDRLMYFAKYYSKSNLPIYEGELEKTEGESLEFKKGLFAYYSSQKSTIEKFSHFYEYETWVPAAEWRQ